MPSEKHLYRGEYNGLVPKWISLEHHRDCALNSICGYVTGYVFQESLKIVFQEFLENLMRYADWGKDHPPEFIAQCFAGPRIEVMTINKPLAGSSHEENLRAKLSQLETAAKSKSMHEDAIASKMFKQRRGQSAGLGLARLVREAGAVLSVRTNSNGYITIQATITKSSILEAARNTRASR